MEMRPRGVFEDREKCGSPTALKLSPAGVAHRPALFVSQEIEGERT